MITYKDFLENGISVIPIDAEKRAFGTWAEFQTRRMTLDEANSRFRHHQVKGLAVICGEVSMGVECLDFDMKYDHTGTLYSRYCDIIKAQRPDLYKRMVITATRNNGYHWIYRCTSAIMPGKHLARRPATDQEKVDNGEQVKVLIETRGDRQYFVTTPSHGYTPIQGSVLEPTLITAEEKEYLHFTAMQFNSYFEAPRQRSGDLTELNEHDPLYKFNQEGDIVPYLLDEGWAVVEDTPEWTSLLRPGKSSAKHSAYFFKDNKIFFVHSTSTVFQADKGYNQSMVYAKLKCGDNFAKARRELAALGFGDLDKMTKSSSELFKSLSLGDRGDAGLLKDLVGQQFRYNQTVGAWMYFESGVWNRDDHGRHLDVFATQLTDCYEVLKNDLQNELNNFEVDKLTTITHDDGTVTTVVDNPSKGMTPVAQKAWKKDKEADLKKVASKILRVNSTEGCKSISTFFSSLEGMSVTAAELDNEPHLINFRNGTYNCLTGKLQPHNIDDRITKMIPFDYLEGANCPNWERFLHETFLDAEDKTKADPDLIEYIQTSLGYALTGFTDVQTLWFAYGKGANGKSTFFETLRMMMNDYSYSVPIDALLTSKKGKGDSSYYIAEWPGKRLIVSTELPEYSKLNESMVKDVTGSEKMTARQIYGKPILFTPSHKLWMFGNHKPVISGTDAGIWRRINLVPFENTVPVHKRRPMKDILAEFRQEMPGIIQWALRGLANYMKTKTIKLPAAVVKGNAEYRESSDPLVNFLLEKFKFSPGHYTELQEVYNNYVYYCQTSGEYQAIQSRRKLGQVLQERGFLVERKTGNRPFVLHYVPHVAENSVTLPTRGGNLVEVGPDVKDVLTTIVDEFSIR